MSVPRPRFVASRVSGDAKLSKIKDVIISLVYGGGGSSGGRGRGKDSLPGPQAAALNRARLRLLRENEYMVCEKSDGERRMLLVSPEDRASYLIDRAFVVEALANGAELCELWCSRAPTLMDGELIIKEADGSAVYMLFDVIVCDGERTGDLPLRDRLIRLGDLRAKFKNRFERPGVPLPSVCDLPCNCGKYASRPSAMRNARLCILT